MSIFTNKSVSDIPDKHRFTVKDAIIGNTGVTPVLDNSLDDNIESDQFLSPNIFSFLPPIKLPSIPLLDNMIIQRPPPPPPPGHMRPFVTVPQGRFQKKYIKKINGIFHY